MTDNCCRPARRPLGVAAAGALLAVLVPKCPLCLAAYLSFLGGAATAVVWLRPFGMVLALIGGGLYLARSQGAPWVRGNRESMRAEEE
jgi:hypothetical protein